MSDGIQNNKEKRIREFLWIIIGISIIFRVLTAILTDNFNHPDENFQIYEQAHRIVFGYGIIPWEFHYDLRSWLVPGFVAAMLYPFRLLGIDDPFIYTKAIKIILSLISVLVVISAYRIGREKSGSEAGLWAAFLCAIWYEIVYFSIRPLSEVWAATFFITAVAVVSGRRDSATGSLAAGVLMALCAAVRIHYLPVVITAALFFWAGATRDDRIRFAGAFILVVIMVGVFDWLTLGGFFRSYVNYFKFGSAYNIGEFPSGFTPFSYLIEVGRTSLLIAGVFLILGINYFRKTAVLIISALVVLISHGIVPMKEHLASIRFVYIAIPLIMAAGGIGIAELRKGIIREGRRRILAITIPIIVALFSLSGALGLSQNRDKEYSCRFFDRDPALAAYVFVHDEANLRAVFDATNFWFFSGGFYYLHREVPLYFIDYPPPSPDYISHIIAGREMMMPKGFEFIRSFGDIVIYARQDKDFTYPADPEYSRDMTPPEIKNRYGE